jgi:hypothetical protein
MFYRIDEVSVSRCKRAHAQQLKVIVEIPLPPICLLLFFMHIHCCQFKYGNGAVSGYGFALMSDAK